MIPLETSIGRVRHLGKHGRLRAVQYTGDHADATEKLFGRRLTGVSTRKQPQRLFYREEIAEYVGQQPDGGPHHLLVGVQVTTRRLDGGVVQEALDGSERHAAAEKRCRVCVPETMGVETYGETGVPTQTLVHLLDSPDPETLAVRAEEEAGGTSRGPILQPGAEHPNRAGVQEDVRGAAALPGGGSEHRCVGVDLVSVEAVELGDAQARVERHEDEREVACTTPAGGSGDEHGKDALDVRQCHRGRETLWHPGALEPRRWVGGELSRPNEPRAEGPEDREAPVPAVWGEERAVRVVGHEPADPLHRDGDLPGVQEAELLVVAENGALSEAVGLRALAEVPVDEVD